MLKFSTDPRLDPLVQETIVLFGGCVLLEGSAETACPKDNPREVPGVTPVFWSSASTAEGIDPKKAPLAAFLFCTTPEQIRLLPGDDPVDTWLELYHNPESKDAGTRAANCLNEIYRAEALNVSAVIRRELPGLLDHLAYPEGAPST